MSNIFLAHGSHTAAVDSLAKAYVTGMNPKILASFFYIKDFNKVKHRYTPTHTCLDSGAYSAWNSGKEIDIEALIQESKDPYWKESVSLDVIGDAEASMKNALYMKSKGSPAYPVFHIGDPWEMLEEYKGKFDKVGLSCRFGEPEKVSMKWLENCFARAWPYKFHSFGWIKEKMLMTFPFHSGDASSWVLAPCAFGTWREMGKLKVRKWPDITAEIDSTLRMERRLKSRWEKELSRWPA